MIFVGHVLRLLVARRSESQKDLDQLPKPGFLPLLPPMPRFDVAKWVTHGLHYKSKAAMVGAVKSD